MVKIAAFYYAPMETVGHGWRGDYEQIIQIFCNSANSVGISPIHICPDGCVPLTERYYICSAATPQLVFDREQAYLKFLKEADETVMFCDPDQVFLRPIPDLPSERHIGVCYRHKDGAAFNGPRILRPESVAVLNWTVNNMRFMTDAYKKWDGDSIAFENAVFKYIALAGMSAIEILRDKFYQSRPSLGADSAAVMYHFKGKNGKSEMIQYAKENGLI